MDNTHEYIEPVTSSTALPETFFKDIVTDSPSCVIVLDAATFKIVFASEQFKELLGFTDEDIKAPGFSFQHLLDEVQVARFKGQLELVGNCITTRKKHFVYQFVHKDGHKEHYYVYASPVSTQIDPDAHYYHLLLLPDLSKWPLPFTSFDTRELFLEQFNGIGFGTFEWIWDTDKIFWSEGAYTIYEIEDRNKDLNYEYLRDHIHADDLHRTEVFLKHTLDTASRLDIEVRIITDKNNLKTVNVLARIIDDGKGRPIKLVGSIRDITQQRQIEQDLKKHVQELSRSNKELEEFAYAASHDLQEPLRKIITFSDRLSEKYKDTLAGDGITYLERMMASAENMRLLISNVLEFSRITTSTQPFAPVDLNFVLRQVKNDLELVVEETNTKIYSTNLPVIDASLTQMKQLFNNIINNAIKFGKANTQPMISITSELLTEQEKKEQLLMPDVNYYRIQIQDNGIGFENEYATRIFQIFQRLHGKSEYPGSGIGLAICKKIVDHHNGSIYAENVSGKGARFNFVLPEKQPNILNTSA